MKRPQRKNYGSGTYEDDRYLRRLEAYCSYIENKNQALQLQQTGVIVQSEPLKTCDHNFADVYDHTGTQIVGKKCLNNCGF